MTFGELKKAVRANVFPTGEAPNQVPSHDKMFVDVLVDLQTVVECLQQDNTEIYPQCATFYDCQMTVFPMPRGNIKSVSVVDRIDPETLEESTTADTDWCRRIYYREIDPCRFSVWKNKGGCADGGCASMVNFFGLAWPLWDCQKPLFPPTDEGLAPGLPPLPMGYHYAQTSTDRISTDGTKRWRARSGVWAKERNNIHIVPWIQSTETIIVVWDGIKRTWTDDDEVDSDPLLSMTVEEYVRWRHYDKYEHDAEESARAGAAYAMGKQALIHQCREETRQRACEPSYARSSVQSLTTSKLYYNTAQTGSAVCPDGTGTASATVPAGAVSSNISVADANQKALEQANTQAQGKLICEPHGGGPGTFSNTEQIATASCSGDPAAPPPDGAPVTVRVAAGLFTSTISQADADSQALAQAQLQAASQLSCVYWNQEQTVTLTCHTDGSITASYTAPAHTFSSTISQSDANDKATAAAQSAATAILAGTCPAGAVVWNTPQSGQVRYPCGVRFITVNWTVAAHYISAPTQLQANESAISLATSQATARAINACHSNNFGIINLAL